MFYYSNIFYITSITRATKNEICTCSKNDNIILCFEMIIAMARFIVVQLLSEEDGVC